MLMPSSGLRVYSFHVLTFDLLSVSALKNGLDGHDGSTGTDAAQGIQRSCAESQS